MAYIEHDSDNPIEFASFYNLNFAVGMGCKNATEDVKLVQFFLQKIYTFPKYKLQTPKGAMKVDGKVGPITKNWILKYQIDADCYPDGIVDKAGNAQSNWETSITRTNYTIRILNNKVRHAFPQWYKTLCCNPEVPTDMRLIFLQMHAQGAPLNYGDA